MSKQLLSSPLSKLNTVRIICRHDKCGSTFELSLNHLCVISSLNALVAAIGATVETKGRSPNSQKQSTT